MATRRTRTRSQPEAIFPLLTPPLPGAAPADPLPTVREDRRQHTGESMDRQFARIREGKEERRSFRERRATRRLAVGLPVEADQARLVTHDLSTFGLSLRGGAPLPRGSRLTLKLFLPDAPTEPLLLDAEVLGPLDATGGARLKFIRPPLEAVQRIHKLVK